MLGNLQPDKFMHDQLGKYICICMYELILYIFMHICLYINTMHYLLLDFHVMHLTPLEKE